MVEVAGARSSEEPYVKEAQSARVARRLAGRTAISLASIKRVPAWTSTSKFSTTSPSNWNTCFPRVKESLLSPMTFSGDDPSA